MTPSPSVLSAWVDGIGLIGPGLPDWTTARALFADETAYTFSPTMAPPPQTLPPAERRRAGVSVRMALAVGHEALTAGQLDARQMATVFASSGADGDNCDAICQVLASDDRHISPTRFHNSVHNAPAGYWGIASGAMAPATVLCGYDGSFSAGLLEAVTQIAVDGHAALLIAYDVPYPEPLHAVRPMPAALGLALALTPVRSPHSIASIELSLSDAEPDRLEQGELEALRRAIPAARGLPLLHALARRESRQVVLDYLEPLRVAVNIKCC